jgi:uncharacterized protein (DUF697 family)
VEKELQRHRPMLKKKLRRMMSASMTRRIVTASDQVLKLKELHGRPSREVAHTMIRKLAPVAAGISFVPGSAFYLSTLELALIGQVARIYGVDPEHLNKRMVLAGLGLRQGVSRGARFAAESLQIIPIVGNVAKGMVGGGVVYMIGQAIVNYFEKRYPDRIYQSPAVEKAADKRSRKAA